MMSRNILSQVRRNLKNLYGEEFLVSVKNKQLFHEKVFSKQQGNKLRTIIVVLFVMCISACTTIQETPEPEKIPDDRAVVDGRVLPLPGKPKIQLESLPGEQSQSSVVRRLMASAQRSRDVNDWEAAANSLERGLRIEPRNAVLWGQLADVRFRQQDWQQAIQLAAKSNALAGNNKTCLVSPCEA